MPIAFALIWQNKLDEAESVLETAIEKNPHRAHLYVHRCGLLCREEASDATGVSGTSRDTTTQTPKRTASMRIDSQGTVLSRMP